jgi:hypothetical protein
VQLGQKEPWVNGLAKEPSLGRQFALIRLDASRYHEHRHGRQLNVCLPSKVISIKCTGHLDVRDEGVDFVGANACEPFVGGASFQNLKSRIPKGIAGEAPDRRVVLDDEYPRRVILSTHAGTISRLRDSSPAGPNNVCFVSQHLSFESYFDLLLRFSLGTRAGDGGPLPRRSDVCSSMSAWAEGDLVTLPLGFGSAAVIAIFVLHVG